MVKIIRSDNGTKFKNQDLNQFCGMKGIKREFSVARTPQHNRITKRKNKTLIEAARTMLANSLLPILFWAEAVNTSCYVQNRVLVTKPNNKTPYELLLGRTPSIGFMRHFGCPMTILNTLDSLGNQLNSSEGIQENFDADKAGEGNVQQYMLFPLWSTGSKDPSNTDIDATFEVKEPESKVHVSPRSCVKTKKHDDKTKSEAKGKSPVELSTGVRNLSKEFEDFFYHNINGVNAASTLVPAVGQNLTNSTNTFSVVGPSNTVVSQTLRKSSYVDPSQYPDDPDMPALEDITYSDDEEDVGAEADFSNLETDITNPKGYTKLLKILVGLKLCRRSFFNSKCKRFGNKARLVAQGHTQEEGIDYEEVFAPVARIEAIRWFLAYASFMGFMVYQMDAKSAFLYETIEEEVYVCQPPGFEDPDYPDKVYKVVKALYGLHQAPRAWCETLANYLLENGFHRGKIDHTLFIKKQKGDILLVQVYVDDIIFGSTNKDLCKAFEKLMNYKFQMSSIGELTFFLGLQVKQKQDGIIISQDKHVAKILRKFGLTDRKSASTPIDTKKPLLKDPDGEDVDVHTYRSMISSLMYLTSSRPDIMFSVCACVLF
uniref:Retrovirus-related Pol polyprotein from transposon TNT 1-94 n=1 Tax=Tanacetum cinerariifolium TaxID=118510 RepID=A0A6L2NIB5_TANCI|nr:retrovirus-related Pol polyprotein from transposon TNT 1-94 [Tanacetum cinerariifolium]